MPLTFYQAGCQVFDGVWLSFAEAKLCDINLISAFISLFSDPCTKAQCVNNSTCVTDMDTNGYKCLCTSNSAGMNILFYFHGSIFRK